MKIQDRFSGFSFDRFRDLAVEVAAVRDKAAAKNTDYADHALALAILGCQVTRKRVFELAHSGEFAGLQYRGSRGLAYVTIVNGVPFRIQPDIAEIRELLPEEQQFLRKHYEVQETLFPEDGTGNFVLRFEVRQPAGKPVEQITLCMFDDQTGVQLDCIVIYARGQAIDFRGSGPDQIVPMQRPPQTPSTAHLYDFPVANDDAENDGE